MVICIRGSYYYNFFTGMSCSIAYEAFSIYLYLCIHILVFISIAV